MKLRPWLLALSIAAPATVLLAPGVAHAGLDACGNIDVKANAQCKVMAQADCTAQCTPVNVEVNLAGDNFVLGFHVDVGKLLPIPDISNKRFPEARQHEEKGLHRILYRFLPGFGAFRNPTRTLMITSFASVIDSNDPDEIEHILDGIPDPAGQFYRFNLAGSLLRAGKPAWKGNGSA